MSLNCLCIVWFIVDVITVFNVDLPISNTTTDLDHCQFEIFACTGLVLVLTLSQPHKVSAFSRFRFTVVFVMACSRLRHSSLQRELENTHVLWCCVYGCPIVCIVLGIQIYKLLLGLWHLQFLFLTIVVTPPSSWTTA